MPTCKYCGTRALAWTYTARQGWRLHNGYELHVCSRGRQQAAERHARSDRPLDGAERYPTLYAQIKASLQGVQPVPHFDPALDVPTAPIKTREMQFTDLEDTW